MKNLVVTLNVGKDVLHNNARSSIREAARRWNCNYFELVSGSGLHFWEEKLHLDEHLPDGVRVCYYDGDVVVRSDCPSPFEIVPEGKLGWVRHDHPSHSGATWHVQNTMPWYCDKVGIEIDHLKEYANTGMMVFDLPLHRPLFGLARDIVKTHGFDRNWVIADQGNFAVARKKLDLSVFWIPPYFQYHGEALWAGWTPELKAYGYHFCGPINKDIAIPRTIWDDLGPDRKISGTNVTRWQQGKPISLVNPPELAMLIREAANCYKGTIVEIGSYLGGTAWHFAQIQRDNRGKFYAVDPWNFDGDIRTHGDISRGFTENMRDAGLIEHVAVLQMTSKAAAEKFDDGSVDMVFIDGDHSKKGCGDDIADWWSKLRVGGVMCGHDYCQEFPGVVEAVAEAFGAPDELSKGDYPVWIVRKREGRLCGTHNELLRYLKGKRVAVVGNAGTLNGSGYGPKIETFDVIIRCNNYGSGGAYAKDVGTRTDIVATTFNADNMSAADTWRKNAPKFFLATEKTPEWAAEFSAKCVYLTGPFRKSIENRIGGNWVTTGYAALQWLMQYSEAAEIHVTGFSFGIAERDHYHTNYNHGFDYARHDPVAEGRDFRKTRTANITVDSCVEAALVPTLLGLYRTAGSTNNIGDIASSPLHYFGFGGYKAIQNSDGMRSNADAWVVGGGVIEPEWYRVPHKPSKLILWGCGASGSQLEYPTWLEKAQLVGLRDYGVGYDWVPCASCMSPLFDAQYSVEHRLVVYKHAVRGSLPEHMAPRMSNCGVTFEQVVRFLGSGEYVLTDSYHGAYWATLLGRKVIVVPWSEKFKHYKHMPTFLSGELEEAMSRAVAYPEALADCRSANIAFADRVANLLSE